MMSLADKRQRVRVLLAMTEMIGFDIQMQNLTEKQKSQ
jgi:hypothetical protein